MTKIKILLIFLAIFFISAVGYGAWRVNRDIDRASQGISSLIVDSVSEDISHLPDQEILPDTDAKDDDIDTSDWKTYGNEEYGFEVKYPEGWRIRITKGKISPSPRPLRIVEFYPFHERTISQEAKDNVTTKPGIKFYVSELS